jgi:hypothetical protein
MTTPITFRCPDDLITEIDSFGQENFPANTASGCDRSKTLVAILASGLNSLSESIPSSTTDEIELLKQVLKDAINQEVIVCVRQELANVIQPLDERLAHLEQLQTGSNQGLLSSKLEVLVKHLVIDIQDILTHTNSNQ